MVELCRVDDRMLHGQVAVTWVNQVAPDAILIANDEAATNEMSKLAFKMAKPAGVKLAIKTVKDAAVLLNDPRTKKNPDFPDCQNGSGCVGTGKGNRRADKKCQHRRSQEKGG